MKVAFILMPAAFLMQFDKHVMAVLAPIIRREYGLSLIEITRVLAATTWTYALFQIPGAWLAGRIGPVRTIGLCVFGWSFAVFLTPLAAGALGLILCRALMGAFQAPDFVSSIMLLQREIPLRLRSRGSAALLAGAYFGTIVSGPTAVEISQTWGWQVCFQAIGAFGMLFGTKILIFTFAVKLDRVEDTAEPRWLGLDLIRTLKIPRVHALAAAYMLFLSVQTFIYIMFPLYLVDVWRTTIVSTGWLSSAPLITLYVSVVSGGILSDAVVRRTGSLFLARVCIGSVAMASSGVCFAIGMSMSSIEAMLVLMCVGMGFVGFGQVILWASVQDASEGAGGFVTAWVQLLGGLGTGLGPVVTAQLVTATGDWEAVRLFLAACGLGAGVCLWLAQPHRPIVEVDWNGLPMRRFASETDY